MSHSLHHKIQKEETGDDYRMAELEDEENELSGK